MYMHVDFISCMNHCVIKFKSCECGGWHASPEFSCHFRHSLSICQIRYILAHMQTYAALMHGTSAANSDWIVRVLSDWLVVTCHAMKWIFFLFECIHRLFAGAICVNVMWHSVKQALCCTQLLSSRYNQLHTVRIQQRNVFKRDSIWWHWGLGWRFQWIIQSNWIFQ